MNQAERNYVTKRIQQEEDRVVAVLRAKPKRVLEPAKRAQQVLNSLSRTKLQRLVVDAIAALGDADLRKLVMVTDSAGSWPHYAHERTVRLNDITVLKDHVPLPGAGSLIDFQVEHDVAEQELKLQIEDIQARGQRCRDRAMLGDGTAALAEFDKFIAELDALLA